MSTRLLALIDGEHYPPVVQAALAEISRQGQEVVGLVFLGGTEKIVENNKFAAFGPPVVSGEDMMASIREGIERFKPQAVVDLSDEPVVGYRERMNIASLVLSYGLEYRGADFHFAPPSFHDVAAKPSLAVIGTGKRVGKTAVAAYACRELKAGGFNPGVVAMGRGGPPEPEVIRGDRIKIDADYLLTQARAGRHAASDHFEDALMSRIPTVGCRRCGGGMAGQPFVSNVVEGARVANGLDVDFLIFEGSGAAMPPIAVDKRLTVAGLNQPVEYITGYLGTYRILISDLVVLTNCEEDSGKAERVIEGIKRIKPEIDVVKTVFRPQPLQDVSGKRVFFATTAPENTNGILTEYLESNYGARVVGISHNLSNRPKLRDDLAGVGAGFDVLLTELKAAAVDVATAAGIDLGKQVIYCDNIPVALGNQSLSDSITQLAERARAEFEVSQIGKKTFTG